MFVIQIPYIIFTLFSIKPTWVRIGKSNLCHIKIEVNFMQPKSDTG